MRISLNLSIRLVTPDNRLCSCILVWGRCRLSTRVLVLAGSFPMGLGNTIAMDIFVAEGTTGVKCNSICLLIFLC
ncbi:hypothetical protein CDL12_11003 [Handroanthus impetiginosus]|uniref:Uncharacterized protein n=1 Tax=Handroanthus impetiginosus TaxID=429701 RepID=A0A2G9HFQ1_9LAMI|nr:hypothetical protein CDL12_11004 [Handroanthus impetiginosus]PIN16351.1 hypothetical protein CDL12_11003 [Handroanthus impetiginosus]